MRFLDPRSKNVWGLIAVTNFQGPRHVPSNLRIMCDLLGSDVT